MRSREELAFDYLGTLPYSPYPLQEEAVLKWFESEQGVMVCAPTGTGKTLIAQSVLFEALQTGKTAYYTTPLIALTEQKFHEMQIQAVRWGFQPEDVGLVTGNRKVNPDAKVLIVVAEILLNRLLHPEGFDFSKVLGVVMDEFHSFADPERGIVWELSLSMLPSNVRLMLLSATVGNAHEFIQWLERCHNRKIDLVQGFERKIPLTYHWVPDQFLGELLVDMAKGDDNTRKTPALVFCFNRDECWSVAEMIKGLDVMAPGQRAALAAEVDKLEWKTGAGPKLIQMLRRGVGVHHAGVMPIYRRKIEELFEKKLLSVAVCTETLAAGINLPARSVVVSSLMKGPFGKEKLIEPSTAHQIFGRAGRPQYDTQGHVFALPHEDDVRILRWRKQYDAIPEDTKDPTLIKKKKELKRKKPERNSQRQYWNESSFEKLKTGPAARLYSKGPLPWRLLAYLLKASPDVDRIRTVVRKRLLDQPRIVAGEKQLITMLLTLHDAGYVKLEPDVIRNEVGKVDENYQPILAHPTPAMDRLLAFRAVHPLYGSFLVDLLGKADADERIQAFESVLELPRPLLKYVRVPWEVKPGILETTFLRPQLEQLGLLKVNIPKEPSEETDEEEIEEEWPEEREPNFAEKLFLYFEAKHPAVHDVTVLPVWAAAEVFRYDGDFNRYVKQRDLIRQEGIIFRHLLRLILLLEEFLEVIPEGVESSLWQNDLRKIGSDLEEICRKVDPTSTEEAIQRAHTKDLVVDEKQIQVVAETVIGDKFEAPANFGEGL
ncbi:DEAD/DEAH box helicase [Telmatocola sphagniphila]|uniref:DEAD/DEAH box helicase n=1 Tax=Telmatocola sphagniphila TaxID=1123043 RepID=A0A8E6B6M3_9BACT|nr:DEAD/DEAH box helicase [Telmatocola sphagniphila]QVL32848.1 DEAD/DEAH box helicase [Telmatocola sphagniphila]